MRKNATELPEKSRRIFGREGKAWSRFVSEIGYIPLEDHIDDAFHKNEQVSRTLEYAFDDAMLGEMASLLGKRQDAQQFRARGENWRNVIDPQTGFARGRHSDGSWETPFDPAKKYSWITEGLPWQYTFFVPQNIPGLVEFEGGQKAFTTSWIRCLRHHSL